MDKFSLKKIIASSTAICLLVTQLLSVTPASAQTPVRGGEVSVRSSLLLDLPASLGTIETSHAGKGSLVIHIQEAHGNAEGQENIRRILHHLRKAYGIDQVLLEGTAFKLHPELLNFYPKDPKRNHEMWSRLMEAGLLTGPEQYLAEDKTASGYGIEEIAPYVANGLAFIGTHQARERSDRFLKELDIQIERLISTHLNSDLRKFLKATEQFESKVMTFEGWLTILKKDAKETLKLDLEDPREQIEWPMMLRLFTLKRIEEKLDASAFSQEKTAFLTILSKFIAKDEPLYKQIESLLSGSSQEKSLTDPETGLLFEAMVERLPQDFPYSRYPNVNRTIGHMILQSELKGGRLFQEMEKLEARISDALAKGSEEKEIVSILKDYKLLQKLFALELTPEDYEVLFARKESIRPGAVIGRFSKLNLDKLVKDTEFKPDENMESLFDKAMEFYKIAKERDGIMTRNIEKFLTDHRSQAQVTSLKSQGTSDRAVVVITGGFHAKPFEDTLAQKGFAYARITPRMTHPGGSQKYTQLVMETFKPKASTWKAPPLPATTRSESSRLGFDKNAFQTAARRALGFPFPGKVPIHAETAEKSSQIRSVAIVVDSADTETLQAPNDPDTYRPRSEIREPHFTSEEMALLMKWEKKGAHRLTTEWKIADERRIREQIIEIETALGKAGAASTANEVLAFVRSGKFKGEELHILDGLGPDARVIGRIDRKIAEKFGYIHETANIVFVAPDGTIILQMRNKDNYDEHLAMFGGHLKVGQLHRAAALKEGKEESGLKHFAYRQKFLGFENYDEPGDTNRERRSWFIRRLTAEEWRQMQEKLVEEARVAGVTDDSSRSEHKARLKKLWGQGKGEVLRYFAFTLDQISNAPRKLNPASPLLDKTSRFLNVTETYPGVLVTTPAFFTPDALDHLVSDPVLWGKVKAYTRSEMRGSKPWVWQPNGINLDGRRTDREYPKDPLMDERNEILAAAGIPESIKMPIGHMPPRIYPRSIIHKNIPYHTELPNLALQIALQVMQDEGMFTGDHGGVIAVINEFFSALGGRPGIVELLRDAIASATAMGDAENQGAIARIAGYNLRELDRGVKFAVMKKTIDSVIVDQKKHLGILKEEETQPIKSSQSEKPRTLQDRYMEFWHLFKITHEELDKIAHDQGHLNFPRDAHQLMKDYESAGLPPATLGRLIVKNWDIVNIPRNDFSAQLGLFLEEVVPDLDLAVKLLTNSGYKSYRSTFKRKVEILRDAVVPSRDVLSGLKSLVNYHAAVLRFIVDQAKHNQIAVNRPETLRQLYDGVLDIYGRKELLAALGDRITIPADVAEKLGRQFGEVLDQRMPPDFREVVIAYALELAEDLGRPLPAQRSDTVVLHAALYSEIGTQYRRYVKEEEPLWPDAQDRKLPEEMTGLYETLKKEGLPQRQSVTLLKKILVESILAVLVNLETMPVELLEKITDFPTLAKMFGVSPGFIGQDANLNWAVKTLISLKPEELKDLPAKAALIAPLGFSERDRLLALNSITEANLLVLEILAEADGFAEYLKSSPIALHRLYLLLETDLKKPSLKGILEAAQKDVRRKRGSLEKDNLRTLLLPYLKVLKASNFETAVAHTPEAAAASQVEAYEIPEATARRLKLLMQFWQGKKNEPGSILGAFFDINHDLLDLVLDVLAGERAVRHVFESAAMFRTLIGAINKALEKTYIAEKSGAEKTEKSMTFRVYMEGHPDWRKGLRGLVRTAIQENLAQRRAAPGIELAPPPDQLLKFMGQGLLDVGMKPEAINRAFTSVSDIDPALLFFLTREVRPQGRVFSTGNQVKAVAVRLTAYFYPSEKKAPPKTEGFTLEQLIKKPGTEWPRGPKLALTKAFKFASIPGEDHRTRSEARLGPVLDRAEIQRLLKHLMSQIDGNVGPENLNEINREALLGIFEYKPDTRFRLKGGSMLSAQEIVRSLANQGDVSAMAALLRNDPSAMLTENLYVTEVLKGIVKERSDGWIESALALFEDSPMATITEKGTPGGAMSERALKFIGGILADAKGSMTSWQQFRFEWIDSHSGLERDFIMDQTEKNVRNVPGAKILYEPDEFTLGVGILTEGNRLSNAGWILNAGQRNVSLKTPEEVIGSWAKKTFRDLDILFRDQLDPLERRSILNEGNVLFDLTSLPTAGIEKMGPKAYLQKIEKALRNLKTVVMRYDSSEAVRAVAAFELKLRGLKKQFSWRFSKLLAPFSVGYIAAKLFGRGSVELYLPSTRSILLFLWRELNDADPYFLLAAVGLFIILLNIMGPVVFMQLFSVSSMASAGNWSLLLGGIIAVGLSLYSGRRNLIRKLPGILKARAERFSIIRDLFRIMNSIDSVALPHGYVSVNALTSELEAMLKANKAGSSAPVKSSLTEQALATAPSQSLQDQTKSKQPAKELARSEARGSAGDQLVMLPVFHEMLSQQTLSAAAFKVMQVFRDGILPLSLAAAAVLKYVAQTFQSKKIRFSAKISAALHRFPQLEKLTGSGPRMDEPERILDLREGASPDPADLLLTVSYLMKHSAAQYHLFVIASPEETKAFMQKLEAFLGFDPLAAFGSRFSVKSATEASALRRLLASALNARQVPTVVLGADTDLKRFPRSANLALVGLHGSELREVAPVLAAIQIHKLVEIALRLRRILGKAELLSSDFSADLALQISALKKLLSAA